VKKSEAIPLQIGNGDFIWSLGISDISLQFVKSIFTIKAVVVDTTAFDAVLGTDFTENEHFGGLLTRPTRLLVDCQEIPLNDRVTTSGRNSRLFRLFKTESYTLTKELRSQILRDLGVPESSVFIDLFANHMNQQEELYLTRENSAWRYNWTKLHKKETDFLWAIPTFSQ